LLDLTIIIVFAIEQFGKSLIARIEINEKHANDDDKYCSIDSGFAKLYLFKGLISCWMVLCIGPGVISQLGPRA
jgi:hypothetical protein